MHYLIKDIDFEKILNFLMQVKGIHKKNIERLRIFIEAIYFMTRGGLQWRLLPFYYGCWRAIHKRWTAWMKRGVWSNMFLFFQQDPDMEWVMIDSTIVRAHACAAGYEKDSQDQQALGRSKGGFSTKIHALTDALGNPLKFILTPGQRNDITQAKLLCEEVSDAAVFADKGYDSDDFIQSLIHQNCDPNIPPRSNRKNPRSYDEFLYQERNVIECFFGKIKHFRRVFSRFDKSSKSYLAFLHFVGALIWIR